MTTPLPMEPKERATFYARMLRLLADAPEGTSPLSKLAETLNIDRLAAEVIMFELREWRWVDWNWKAQVTPKTEIIAQITMQGLVILALAPQYTVTAVNPWMSNS
jgi:DNA-binding IclR family transcriptional regulator